MAISILYAVGVHTQAPSHLDFILPVVVRSDPARRDSNIQVRASEVIPAPPDYYSIRLAELSITSLLVVA